MAENERTLTEEQLATISGNMLQKTLIDVSRTVGKRIFRELESGTRIALTQPFSGFSPLSLNIQPEATCAN